MPRKKKNGNNGDNLGKDPSPPDWSDLKQKHGSQAHEHCDMSVGSLHLGEGSRDHIFQELQQMFRGKVEEEVVHMILDECDWKVEDALESLLKMAPASDEESDGKDMETGSEITNKRSSRLPLHLPSLHAISRDFSPDNPGGRPESPPMMSDGEPMTPLLFTGDTQSQSVADMPVNLNFFSLPNTTESHPVSSTTEDSFTSAMTALDSYINRGPYSDPEKMFSQDFFKFDSDQTSDQKDPHPVVSSENSTIQNVLTEDHFGSRDINDNSENTEKFELSWGVPGVTPSLLRPSIRDIFSDKSDQSNSAYSQLSADRSLRERSPRINYERTISLEPLEAANLEQLVQDVVISGVGEESDFRAVTGADSEADIYSGFSQDTLSSEGNSKSDENQNVDAVGELGNLEKSQSNLKVAVKHMKELPPRFLRKLITEDDDVKNGEEATDSSAKESGVIYPARVLTPASHRYVKKEWKKVNVGDSNESMEISSLAVNMEKLTGLSKSPVIHCSDLEEAMINSSPSTPHSGSSTGTEKYQFPKPPDVQRIVMLDEDNKGLNVNKESDANNRKSNFSVNAPEFVPRFAASPVPMHPSAVTGELMMHTSPMSVAAAQLPHPSVYERLSPQLGISASSPVVAPGRNSPIFMSPGKVHKGLPVGFVPMPFYPYPYPGYTRMPYPVPVNPFLGATWKDLKRANATAMAAGVNLKHAAYMPYSMAGKSAAARHAAKDKNLHHLQINDDNRPKSAPTIIPQNSRMAANLPPQHVQGSSLQKQKDQIREMLAKGSKVMVLMRGCPGSGKTTLAKEMKMDGVILSTDDFFMRGDKYEWDPMKLSEAHEWNHSKAAEALSNGVNPVIIDNTNVKLWEMKPYVKQAIKHHYHVEFMEPDTSWNFSARELHKRNSHNVPMESIKKMVESYESNATVGKVMGNENILKEKVAPQTNNSEENSQLQPQVKKRVRVRKRRSRRRKKGLNAASISEKTEDDNNPSNSGKDHLTSIVLEETLGTSEDERDGRLGDISSGNESSSHPEPSPDSVKEKSVSFKETNNNNNAQELANKANGAFTTKNSQLQYMTPEKGRRESSDLESSVGSTDQTISRETSIERVASSGSSEAKLESDNQPQNEKANQKLKESENETSSVPLSTPSTDSKTHPDSLKTQIEKKLKQILLGKENIPENLISGMSDKQQSQGGQSPVLQAFVAREHEKIMDGLANEEVEQITSGMCKNDESHELLKAPVQQPIMVVNPFQYQDEVDCADVVKKSSSEEEYDISSNSECEDDIQRQVEVFTKSSQLEDEFEHFLEAHRNSRLASVKVKELDKDSDELLKQDLSASSQFSEVDGTPKVATNNNELCDTFLNEKSDQLLPEANSSPCVSQATDIHVSSSIPDVPNSPITPVSPSMPTHQASTKTSSRKRLAAKFQSEPLKFLGDQLLNSSIEWDTPPFTSDLPAEVVEDSVRVNKSISYIDAASETNIADFNFVYRVDKSEEVTDHSVYTLRSCTARIIGSNTSDEVSEGESGLAISQSKSVKLKLDKGCMTEELVKPASSEEEFEFVHACFPSVPIDDLQHILSQCKGDVEWTINILLDSGYECSDLGHVHQQGKEAANESETGVKIQSNLTPEKEANDTTTSNKVVAEDIECVTGSPFSDSSTGSFAEVPTEEKRISLVSYDTTSSDECASPSTSESASGEVVQSPPQLAFLCCKKCSVADVLCNKEVQQRAFKGNLRRLLSVEEFQRSHHGSTEESVLTAQSTDIETHSCSSTLQKDSQEIVAWEDAAETTENTTHITEGHVIEEATATTADTGASNALSSDSDVIIEEAHGALVDDIDDRDKFGEENLYIKLDPELASSLLKMFGPVGSHLSPDSLPESDMKVRLNRKLAHELYRQWTVTLQESTALENVAIQKMIKDGDVMDEEFARRLQSELDYEDMMVFQKRETELSRIEKEKAPTRLRPHPLVGIGGGGISGIDVVKVERRIVPPPSLKTIMDEERAVEESKKRMLAIQDEKGTSNEISTKLKNKKLHEMFPTVDKTVLDEVYQATGYSLERTVQAVQDMCDTEAARAPSQRSVTDEDIIKNITMEGLRQKLMDKDKNENTFQTLDDPDYQDFRAEASVHHKLRHECFQKAQDAYRQGMKPVASFYSQQGHLHTEKLREANRRAAEKILEYRNANLEDSSSIDLHGLHASEALQFLKQVIAERETEVHAKSKRRRTHISVVTGRGSHSRGGVARIKPVIIDFLDRNNYSYTEPHAGVIRIVLK